MSARKEREGLRALVLDNIGLKLLSLAAALLLFSLTRGAEDAQRAIFVDVVAVLPDASSGRILLSEIPDRVRVTLRGSRAMLNSIARDDIPPIQVSLEDTSQRIYYFEPDHFEIPAGIEIAQIAPATIPLQWVDRGERSLPVRPTLDGRVGDGLMLSETLAVRPATVTVAGPAQEISPLDHITTEPIQIGMLEAGRYERRVGLVRLAPHSEYVGPDAVTVLLEIVPRVAERSIPRVEVAAVGGAVRELRPSRVRLRLRGPPEALDALDPLGIVPFVDASTLDPAAGAQAVPVRVRGIPEGVELAGVEPADVLATPPPPPHR